MQSLRDTLLHLWCLPDVGPKTIHVLMPFIEQGWRFGEPLPSIENLNSRQRNAVQHKKNQVAARRTVETILKWAVAPDHHVVFNDVSNINPPSDYPALLSEIYSPPGVLMVKGRLEVLSSYAIGMVGSRHPSREGVKNASLFASYLAQQGITIISGGAAGIDRVCHEAALQAGGETIAVLGHALDFCYPASHKSLFAQIAAQGALVSEFPLGIGPRPQFFPRRNRIITGLSLGICVVEAGLPSGSLVSAKWAYEQNREVFAIPGSIHNPRAKGCHFLIQQGAKLVQAGEDILVELPDIQTIPARLQSNYSDAAQEHLEADSGLISSAAGARKNIVEDAPPFCQNYKNTSLPLIERLASYLKNKDASLDELHQIFSDVEIDQLSSHLTTMEIEGAVQRHATLGVYQSCAEVNVSI